MDRFVIEGGVPLRGRVPVRPAKNALLPCLTAALLTAEPVRFTTSAALRDIVFMVDLLRHLGAEVEGEAGGALTVTAAHIPTPECPYDLVRKMRASVVTLGPLVARYGRARVSLPGGCAIGTRPVDQHLKALAALGADITLEHGYIEASGKLRGGEVVFDVVTVGGTENILMAAALAEGTTVIRNAAREPEVGDLARLLIAMGARVGGVGTDALTVEGVRELHGADHACIADRVEAGTLLMAGPITGGDVTVTDCVPAHVESLLVKLRSMGATVEAGEDWARAAAEPGALSSADITTAPYPAYPTDLQAQFMALLTQAEGLGAVKETIFENRFMHVPELQRMGADIRIDGNMAVVRGQTPLTGAPTMASDLRASACLVLAGLAAEGTSEVRRIYHLDRGYERLEERLNALGARVRREREE